VLLFGPLKYLTLSLVSMCERNHEYLPGGVHPAFLGMDPASTKNRGFIVMINPKFLRSELFVGKKILMTLFHPI